MIWEKLMHGLMKIILLLVICGCLSACAVALLGGGAAGGYWFGDNYKVQKKS